MPLDSLQRHRLDIPAAGGLTLALHRVWGDVTHPVPVIVTHGTSSNAQVCNMLAQVLALEGFDCYVLEWQAHGESGRAEVEPNFEQLAQCDVPAALAAVRARTGSAAFWVGHSGGGLLPLIHLARTPEAAEHIAGLVTLASQTTDAARSWRNRLTVATAAVVTQLLGRFPGRALRVGPENELKGVMHQWFGWSWRGKWVGHDGFDYMAAMKGITLPTLSLAGAGDTLIAPPSGVERLFHALGSADKTFVTCGTAHGFGEDYTHSRLIASRRARDEVYPLIARWLTERASPR